MKRLLQFLMLFIPFIAHSQHWEIFNSYDRYNYKLSGAPLITNTLFADSFKVTGSDTIYYLNRIVQRPNNIRPPFGYGPDTLLKYLPQFFQKQIRRSPDGTYIFHTDIGYTAFYPKKFVVKSFADVGDSWVYDTINNVTATVANKNLQILFGTTDSVKQINLSNGDSILLSKSFGIIGFPSDTLTDTGQTPVYYNLQGIETRSVGDSLINFWSIYNFKVGDVFVYHITDKGGSSLEQGFLKYSILTKATYSDSIKYLVRRVYSETEVPSPYSQYPLGFYTHTDTIMLTFVDSATHLSNTYNGESTRLYSLPKDYNLNQGYPGASCSSFYFLDTLLNLPCKGIEGIYRRVIEDHDTIPSYDTLYRQYYITYSCFICEGVGDAHFNTFDFEAGYSQDLIGYIKNGIQTGIVMTDSAITGISMMAENISSVNLYPNIAGDFTYVHLSDVNSSRVLQLSVYDLTGRQMLHENLTSNLSKISCSNLSSAMYLWRVVDEKGNVLGSGKLVKE